MESNAMPGGIYSSVSPGTLGLEMSLNHNIPPQNPNHQQQQQQQRRHNPMAANGHREGEYRPQTQQSVKQGHPYVGKAKNQTLTLSDNVEHGPENTSDDGNLRMSPWHRVKWNDNMVRLLIMIVFYIGDEVGSEANDPANKKGGVILQRKGKWKSVSRAMMEKGFYVSPQQCEDKFNDLNKRYKRVNDILGKGTACQVVENQSLLDSMDHISPKMKEEVKKLLNSKHLFFREMCAYHNSCGHGPHGSNGSGAVANQHSPAEVAAEPSHTQYQSQQQRCLHSSVNASVIPNLNRGENEGSKLSKGASEEEEDDDDDDDDDDDNEDDGDGDGDSYQDNNEVFDRGSTGHDHGHGHEDDNDTDGRSSMKRQRKNVFDSPFIQQLNMELMNILQDGTKSPSEKRQWVKERLMHLEDQRVGIECQAFELEKQRLKWLKFSTKKKREMEREKLANERLRLQNERMALLIRQKELELLGHHHYQLLSSNKMGDPSITR